VQKYLIENFGIGVERLQVASYGNTRPRGNSQANQELNHRVEFSKLK
jgi:outer membrane protein OmpA-like peptidoglycan-associated protein